MVGVNGGWMDYELLILLVRSILKSQSVFAFYLHLLLLLLSICGE